MMQIRYTWLWITVVIIIPFVATVVVGDAFGADANVVAAADMPVCYHEQKMMSHLGLQPVIRTVLHCEHVRLGTPNISPECLEHLKFRAGAKAVLLPEVDELYVGCDGLGPCSRNGCLWAANTCSQDHFTNCPIKLLS
jgi:hypothetical protein